MANGNGSRTPGEKNNYHLVLLCRNQTGYRNLIQIVTRLIWRFLLQATHR